MKTVILFASVVACALSLKAQITATLDDSFPGRPEIQVRSHSTLSLAAIAISMASADQTDLERAPFLVFKDTAVDPDAKPLLPDRVYRVPVMVRHRWGQAPETLFQLPIVAAGILADGTTTGDPVLVSRLIVRRCNMLLAVEQTRETLFDAGRHHIPRAQLIEQFKKMADSVSRWYLPAEQQVGRTLYLSIVEKLLNLPELQAGAPFPPAEFVEQETAVLGRQRMILLESEPSLASVRR